MNAIARISNLQLITGYATALSASVALTLTLGMAWAPIMLAVAGLGVAVGHVLGTPGRVQS